MLRFIIATWSRFDMAKSGGGPKMPPSPKTAPNIKHIAAEGLKHPSSLPAGQVRELAASVMRHIEPRKGGKT
jgi:hypothetical protein